MNLVLFDVWNQLPPTSVMYILLVAVIISPWIRRWQLRLRRWLTRASIFAAGVLIGTVL